MGIATAIKTRRGGGWRSQVASSLAALGAAGILMTGCSDESVSPAAPSAVTAVVSEPTASAAANGIVTPSGGGLPEPGRAQAAPDAEPVVGMEADTADTLLVRVRLFFVGGPISLFGGGEAGGNWIRQGVVRSGRRVRWPTVLLSSATDGGLPLVLARFVRGLSTHQGSGCPRRLQDRRNCSQVSPRAGGLTHRVADQMPTGPLDEPATSTARRVAAATWMMSSTTVASRAYAVVPANRGGRDGHAAAHLDQVALRQQVQRGIEPMRAVVTAPRAGQTHNLHRAGGRFGVAFVLARLGALDTAGVLGRTSSLFRAALVAMSLQELAYQILAPPVQFPFEFALAHLPRFAGREDRLWHPRRQHRPLRTGLALGRSMQGTPVPQPRRMYVAGILSSQPSQACLPSHGTVPERRVNVQKGARLRGTDRRCSAPFRGVGRGRRKDAGTRWLGCWPPEMSTGETHPRAKRPMNRAKTPRRRRAAPFSSRLRSSSDVAAGRERCQTNLRAETSVSGIGVDLSNGTGQSDLFADESAM